ncbi:MAG TPA: DMT family transporter, partial [Candidatus Udaeobacter sp.]|nr:DMT family transporter [Candidatus Udaeobacter sp.]
MASLRPLDWRGTATALMLAALWGANPVAVKVGLADAPPLRLAFFRFVLGGLVVLAYARWTRHPGVFDVRPGEWRVLISLGVIFSVQIGTMNVGIGLTTASHCAVLLNSYAVHTVVLAHFMIPGDRLTSAKIGGVLIA